MHWEAICRRLRRNSVVLTWISVIKYSVTTEVVICCLCCSEGGVVVDTTRSKGASHWVWGESISLWRWAIPQRVAQEVVQCLSVRISGIWVEKSLNQPLCPCSWPCSDGIPAYCSDCESLMGAELAWLWKWEETKDRSFVTEQREGWKKPRFLFICRGREWWVNIKYQRCKIINIKRSGSKDLKLVINTWGVEMRNFLLWEVKLWEEAPKSSPRGGKCVCHIWRWACVREQLHAEVEVIQMLEMQCISTLCRYSQICFIVSSPHIPPAVYIWCRLLQN